MKVVVGLGNPDLKYHSTRHNAGFRVVDRLGTASGAHFSAKRDLHCDLAKVEIAGQEVLLVKPTTYMNLSGRSVVAVLSWYKVQRNDLLVVHDDVSLPLGRIRLQKAGGAGGQHGVESIIECFGGAKEFHRLKFGVGPDPGGSQRASFVLSSFPEDQRELLERSIALAAEAVGAFLKEGILLAMNQFNGIQLDLPPLVEAPELLQSPGRDEKV
jgi:PTH1 family peptidyl-tRNA hydrolase